MQELETHTGLDLSLTSGLDGSQHQALPAGAGARTPGRGASQEVRASPEFHGAAAASGMGTGAPRTAFLFYFFHVVIRQRP